MRDYFGYDVNFVMNITDIDDKVGSALKGKNYADLLDRSSFVPGRLI